MNGVSADVAVVGAGLVGASLAWGMARRGASIALLDAGDDRLHASAGNFGLVWVQGKGAGVPEYARLSRRSADGWKDFADELRDSAGPVFPPGLGYRPSGGVKIALSESEMEALASTVRRMHNQADPTDNDTTLLDRGDLEAILPNVGPKAVGGTWCPHDGHADPLATVAALHTALSRDPAVRIVRGTVERISPDGGGFRVVARDDQVAARRVVLAAGLGNVALAGPLGLNADLRPQRGQIVVTERTGPLLEVATHTVRQTSDGTLLLGDSKEEVGHDIGTTPEVAWAILRRAVDCFPALARVRVARVWGALRVMSPDGLPIYQTSPRHPGASLVTCHSGVTLAAAHAAEVAEAILSDRLNETYPDFSPSRFGRAA